MYVIEVDDSLSETTTYDIFPCATYTTLNSSSANIFLLFFLMICSMDGTLEKIQCDGQNIEFSNRGHFYQKYTVCIVGSDANTHGIIIGNI